MSQGRNRDQIPFSITVVCQAYAQLRCAARVLARSDQPAYAELLRDTADMLLDEAPAQAFPDLDAVKRIMEIDERTTDPALILQRAAIPVPEPG